MSDFDVAGGGAGAFETTFAASAAVFVCGSPILFCPVLVSPKEGGEALGRFAFLYSENGSFSSSSMLTTTNPYIITWSITDLANGSQQLSRCLSNVGVSFMDVPFRVSVSPLERS